MWWMCVCVCVCVQHELGELMGASSGCLYLSTWGASCVCCLQRKKTACVCILFTLFLGQPTTSMFPLSNQALFDLSTRTRSTKERTGHERKGISDPVVLVWFLSFSGHKGTTGKERESETERKSDTEIGRTSTNTNNPFLRSSAHLHSSLEFYHNKSTTTSTVLPPMRSSHPLTHPLHLQHYKNTTLLFTHTLIRTTYTHNHTHSLIHTFIHPPTNKAYHTVCIADRQT
jgi:hypothetical protein